MSSAYSVIFISQEPTAVPSILEFCIIASASISNILVIGITPNRKVTYLRSAFWLFDAAFFFLSRGSQSVTLMKGITGFKELRK